MIIEYNYIFTINLINVYYNFYCVVFYFGYYYYKNILVEILFSLCDQKMAITI